jgi:hypothetical protein
MVNSMSLSVTPGALISTWIESSSSRIDAGIVPPQVGVASGAKQGLPKKWSKSAARAD